MALLKGTTVSEYLDLGNREERRACRREIGQRNESRAAKRGLWEQEFHVDIGSFCVHIKGRLPGKDVKTHS